MARAFSGNIMSSLETSLSLSTTSADRNSATTPILANVSNTRGSTLSYLWKITGNASNINSSRTGSTHVSGRGTAGKTKLFCEITDSLTGVTTISPTCEITWNPAIPVTSVTWSIASATASAYNGSAQSVTVVSINPIGATYSLVTTPATNFGGIASTILTGTGIYEGSVTSPNITIGKSVITIASSGSTSFSYNSSSKTVGYTVSGVYAADTNYAVSGTSSTNAGSYTASLTTTSSNYVLGTTTTVPWSITKALLTLTTSNKSMTYSSSVPTQTFGYSLSGLLGGDTANVITGTASHSTTATSTSNVGSYPITTNFGTLSATNYTFAAVNGTLTISAATLTASTTTGSATYTGGSQAVTVLGGINGTTYTGSTSVSGTNAGSYTTTITGTGNYTGSVIGTLTINAATLTATTREGSATYNGSSQSVTVLSGINGTTFSGLTSVSGTNAGSYTTIITGTGNYTGSVIGTLTISPATLTATSTGSATYNGLSQTVTVLSGINGTFSGSTSVSGINAGSYTTTITGTGNYTGSVTGTLTISPATLTATSTTGSATYNGGSQAVTVFSGINGAFTGSASVSGTNVGSYSTTITGTGNHTGSITGTLTINRATLTASSISSYETYNRGQQSFTISGINGSYSGSPTVYGTGVGSYSTTIFGTGNYTGSVTGTLNIRTDSGYVDIFYGGVHDASRTSSIFVPVRTSNAAFTVTHSVSGPGAADAQHTSFGRGGPYDWNGLYDPVPPGAVVRNTNPYTQGFVVTITAAINDSNYSFMSATTSVTVNAYSAPSGGFITE